MDAIPLSAPDGTIYTWICGKCRHVRNLGEMMVPHTDEYCATHAERAKNDATKCCSCKHCGAYIEMGSHYSDPQVEGEPRRYHDCCLACWPAQVVKILAQQKEWQIERDAVTARYEYALTKSSDSNAARRLEALISEISEDTYCSGWNSDIEHQLWEQLPGYAVEYGMASISDDERAELNRLHNLCGGWWDSRTFVTDAEWEPIHAEYLTRTNAWREKRRKELLGE